MKRHSVKLGQRYCIKPRGLGTGRHQGEAGQCASIVHTCLPLLFSLFLSIFSSFFFTLFRFLFCVFSVLYFVSFRFLPVLFHSVFSFDFKFNYSPTSGLAFCNWSTNNTNKGIFEHEKFTNIRCRASQTTCCLCEAFRTGIFRT